jgi:HK97 family phage major capsid protein
MALYTSTTNTRGILPDDHGPLVVQPLMTESVAALVSTVVSTSANRYRIPTVTADPTAAWVAEGAEIPITDPTLAELTVTATKVAGLTIVSRELADDSNPAAANVVGQGLARDIARKVDGAFFGAQSAPAPSGWAPCPVSRPWWTLARSLTWTRSLRPSASPRRSAPR